MSTMDVSCSVVDQSQSCNVNELLSYISNNDIKSFKQGLKIIDPKELSRVITETITIKGRKEFFDVLLDKLEVTIKSDPSIFSNSLFYKQCIAAISNSSDTYYAIRLTEVYKHATPAEKGSLLCLAVHFENKLISHQLILSGADINGFDLMGTTPLEEAIKCNNLELVCMLLYYGADVDLSHLKLTAFMYSIICESSEEIQSTLLEYECDFNLSQDGMSTLFFAIKHNSPVALEIIKRGADINYDNGISNAISLAIECNCDHEVFRLLWNEFDYEMWETNDDRSSVLLTFFEMTIENPMFEEYLNVLMENEAKLKLDIEYHSNSCCYESDPIISSLYLECCVNDVDDETTESFALHLLSHGLQALTEDVDIIYYKLDDSTPPLDMLLYMDLYDNNEGIKSFMYFKYTPIPGLESYLMNVLKYTYLLLDSIEKLRGFYAFKRELQTKILNILGSEESDCELHKEALEATATFPSLLQLARDAARERICLNYNIKSSCMLHTIIRNLGLPDIIQDILLLNESIY